MTYKNPHKLWTDRTVKTLADTRKEKYNKFDCCYCKRRVLKPNSDAALDDPELVISIEHKTYPKSKGGDNDPRNLDISCKRCNGLRGSIAIELFEPFARVVIQRYPNAPTPVLREALRKYIYHLATLSIKNNSGIKAATLATLIEIDSQLEKRDLQGISKNVANKRIKD